MIDTRKHSSHIDALDGIRALAIIFVLCRHSVKSFWDIISESFTYANYNFLTVLHNGWIGVDLFFILSGFLITLTFIKHQNSKKPVHLYLYKRFLRIAPCYYVVLFICVAGITFGAIDTHDNNIVWRTFYHLLFLQDYLKPDINVVFWSLGVEEKFYLISPLLLPLFQKVMKRHRISGVLTFIFFIIIIGTTLRTISYINASSPETFEDFFLASRAPFHSCFDPFLVGIFIAILYREYNAGKMPIITSLARPIFILSASLLSLIMLAFPFGTHISYFDVIIQPFLTSLILGGLVFGAVFQGGFKWLNSAPMAFFARMAYCLYLVHMPLRQPSFEITKTIPGALSSNTVFFFVFIVVYTLISLSCAYVLHTVVEKPFLRLKNKY